MTLPLYILRCWPSAAMPRTHAALRHGIRHALHRSVGFPRRTARIMAHHVTTSVIAGAWLTCVLVPIALATGGIPGVGWPSVPLPYPEVLPVQVPEPGDLPMFLVAVGVLVWVREGRVGRGN